MPTEERSHGRRASDNASVTPNWQIIGILVALGVQFAGLLRNAATTVAALNSLQLVVAEVKAQTASLSAQSNATAARIGVLEFKVDDVRSRQNENGGTRR